MAVVAESYFFNPIKMAPTSVYKGRFAPSPTGPLHAGSLVTAMASWLDARAQGGKWLIRIEDVDTPRSMPGADQSILAQLASCGLHSDETPIYQSQRSALYQAALDRLMTQALAYPCGCTRQDIVQFHALSGQARARHGELLYPGTCRNGLAGREARAWRFLTDISSKINATQLTHTKLAINSIAVNEVQWMDQALGLQTQNVSQEVGDFILKRADGLWAYQLAVVVDDAAQGITHVVRGEDLTDNTARQILLQRALGIAQPIYRHTPLVMGLNGEKLSKQNGAQALDISQPLAVLKQAGRVLGLPENPGTSLLTDWLQQAVSSWASQTLKIRA